jgi:hypothetical protein
MPLVSYGLRTTEMSARFGLFVEMFSWLFIATLIGATIAVMFG